MPERAAASRRAGASGAWTAFSAERREGLDLLSLGRRHRQARALGRGGLRLWSDVAVNGGGQRPLGTERIQNMPQTVQRMKGNTYLQHANWQLRVYGCL